MSESPNTIVLIKDGSKFNVVFMDKVILEKIPEKDLFYIFAKNNSAGAFNRFNGSIKLLNDEINIDSLIASLKVQFKAYMPEIKKEKLEAEVLPEINSWIQFESDLNKLIRDRSEDFKFVLSVIVSYWFINSDDDFCNYFLMLAPKGKGKSALLSSFNTCTDFVECLDNMTMEAWAPGSVDGKKVIGVADMVEDKTLMIHDVTSLFGNNEDKVKKILWDFEQSFGMEPFRKGMPGAIQEFGGGWNGIFGIPPILFRNNRISFLQTSRFFVYQLSPINERDIIQSNRNRPKKTDIRRLCKAYLNHLNTTITDFVLPVEVRDYIIDFLQVYVEYLKVYQGAYHNWEAEGIIRRYNQVETLIKARCIVSENHTPTIQDAKYWLRMLWFGDTPAQVRDKLALTNIDEDDYIEFIDIV